MLKFFDSKKLLLVFVFIFIFLVIPDKGFAADWYCDGGSCVSGTYPSNLSCRLIEGTFCYPTKEICELTSVDCGICHSGRPSVTESANVNERIGNSNQLCLAIGEALATGLCGVGGSEFPSMGIRDNSQCCHISKNPENIYSFIGPNICAEGESSTPGENDFWVYRTLHPPGCQKVSAPNKSTCESVNNATCYDSLEECQSENEAEGATCTSWLFTPMQCLGKVFSDALTEFLNIIVGFLIKFILTIFLFLIGVVVWLLSALMAVIISIFNLVLPALIAVPVMGDGAPIVGIMWTFVRDFANLFFLLFFVIIGLATILKIESYKFQKTLPLLIIMALLVNFSLVLVGLIVDAGNILTSLFIDGVVGQGGGFNTFLGLASNIFSGIGDLWQINAGIAQLFAIGMAYTVYALTILAAYLFGFFVFMCIFFILIWRIAILWVLAIFSPLAFVSYIFVSTRKMIWSRWLKNLIQWSFVAVPILFFMIIGFGVLNFAGPAITTIVNDMGGATTELPSVDDMASDMPGDGTVPPTIKDEVQNTITGLVAAMLTPMLGLIIMFIGLLISMTLIPEGAQSAIDAGKKTGQWAGRAGSDTIRNIPAVNRTEKRWRRSLEFSPLARSIGIASPGGVDNEERERVKNQRQVLDNLPNDAARTEYVQSLRGLRETKDRYAASAALLNRTMDDGDDFPEEVRNNFRSFIDDAVASGVFSENKLRRYSPTSAVFNLTGDQVRDILAEKSPAQIAKIPQSAYRDAQNAYQQGNTAPMESLVEAITKNTQSIISWSRNVERGKQQIVSGYINQRGGRQGFPPGTSQEVVDAWFTLQ